MASSSMGGVYTRKILDAATRRTDLIGQPDQTSWAHKMQPLISALLP